MGVLPRKRFAGYATGAMLLLLPLAGGFAQFTRAPLRGVQGTVMDHGQEPIRGAVVEIEAADTLAIESYVTDERGVYHFRNLRPDADYALWASFRGNRSKTHKMSHFDKQTDREIPIVITLDK